MDGPLDHSPPHAALAPARGEQASWRTMRDTAIAETVGDGEAARTLAIADLSPLPRLGFKGRGTIEAMKKRGITVEATPNSAYRQPDGGLCLVLAPSEVILLSNLAGEGAKLADMGIAGASRTRSAPIRCCGGTAMPGLPSPEPQAPAMFAKICAIDLRPTSFRISQLRKLRSPR